MEKESGKGEKSREKVEEEEKSEKSVQKGVDLDHQAKESGSLFAKRWEKASTSKMRIFEATLSLPFPLHNLSLPHAYINKAIGSLLHTIEEHTSRGDHHLLHPQP